MTTLYEGTHVGELGSIKLTPTDCTYRQQQYNGVGRWKHIYMGVGERVTKKDVGMVSTAQGAWLGGPRRGGIGKRGDEDVETR